MTPIIELRGVGQSLDRVLRQNGIASVEDLAQRDLPSLMDIRGIGENLGAKLLSAAQALLAVEDALPGDADAETGEPQNPPEGSEPDMTDKASKEEAAKLSKKKATALKLAKAKAEAEVLARQKAKVKAKAKKAAKKVDELSAEFAKAKEKAKAKAKKAKAKAKGDIAHERRKEQAIKAGKKVPKKKKKGKSGKS